TKSLCWPPDGARSVPVVSACRSGYVAHSRHAHGRRCWCAHRLGRRLVRSRPDRRRGDRAAGRRDRRRPPLPGVLLVSGAFATPRPVPESGRPALAGTAVIVIALPVFLVAGWSLAAWGIAGALWAAYQAIGFLLRRLELGSDNLAAAG